MNGNKGGGIMKNLLVLSIVCIAAVLLLPLSLADPSGTSISGNTTSSRSSVTPSTRSDNGGTITTMIVSAVQQNINWKAYVGNISGLLTLDDANNKTIYDWSLTSLTGELYASRTNSPTWASLNCSSLANITTEHTALGFAGTDSDAINRTFNETTHSWFLSGLQNMTGCRSTAMFVNDTRQGVLPNADFQEIVASDGTNIVFVSVLENDAMGYVDDVLTFDFQMIVPQNKSTSTATPYYFWVELG